MKLLKELSFEELKELYDSNKQFSNKVYELAYDIANDQLCEWLDLSRINKTFDIDSTSYGTYITRPYSHGVREGIAIAHQLETDYLSEEQLKLYDKVCELADIYNNTTYEELEKWEEEHDVDLREQADIYCDELAELLTKDVKEYDNITDEQIEQVLNDIAEGYSGMSDWETENGVVYETVVNVYK